MRRISINGAVFLFLVRGEKLERRHLLSCNYLPDPRYVLWPRGAFWDVRYFNWQTDEMLPIADEPFSDEPDAWLAAFAHWEKLSEKSLFIYDQSDNGDHEVFRRIPFIGN